MHTAIHLTGGLVSLAHEVFATCAFSSLIPPNRFICSTLTIDHTRGAQPPAPVGSVTSTPRSVVLTHVPPADRARGEARVACQMIVLCAGALVLGTVFFVADLTLRYVCVTGRQAIYVARNDSVVPAERFVADRTAVATSVAGHMIVDADRNLGRRGPACRTAQNPRTAATQRSRRSEDSPVFGWTCQCPFR